MQMALKFMEWIGLVSSTFTKRIIIKHLLYIFPVSCRYLNLSSVYLFYLFSEFEKIDSHR